MVVLDTNHLSVLDKSGHRAKHLGLRLEQSRHEVSTAVVCVRERIDGWLAEVRRLEREPHLQVRAYFEFYAMVENYSRWTVLPWDEDAADLYVKHRANGIRIGTMDLKIACIAITHDALLLTQNSVDFAKVPGLRFADWLVE